MAAGGPLLGMSHPLPGRLRLPCGVATGIVLAILGLVADIVTHYLLRWESTHGDVGPWSETARATIGA